MGAEPVRLSRLAAVADEFQTARLDGADVTVVGIEHDSRAVRPGQAFIALRGSTSDGHDYAASTLTAGAAALIVDHSLELDVPQLVVEATRPLMAPLAAEVYGRPSAAMTVIGVTGTNGKTTTTHMIEAIGAGAGRTMGLIGTVGARIAGKPHPVGFTTPEATHLQRLLRTMLDADVDTVAMEVSSHALAQGRADAIDFDVVAFTNLSQDHLDYHGTMEEYYAVKRTLFRRSRAALAVVFVDDPWGARLAGEIDLPLSTVGFEPGADVRGVALAATPAGTTIEISSPQHRFEVTTTLAGGFNAANALVAVASALAVGIHPDDIGTGLQDMAAVPGRFEAVACSRGFDVIVDYAHTPDAIATIIGAVRPLTAGRIIAVGGAGGDRDITKRPLMGGALATADAAVVTSDNPRSEDPNTIVDAVLQGVPADRYAVAELDRREAIRLALQIARTGDVVLILGKGHETGQQLADRTIPFDDRIVAAEELARLDEEQPA